MSVLFLVVLAAIFGGVIWALMHRKAKNSGGTKTGGGNLPEDPTGPINDQ